MAALAFKAILDSQISDAEAALPEDFGDAVLAALEGCAYV